MDNSFIIDADCTQPVRVLARIANAGGQGFYRLDHLDPAGPSDSQDDLNQAAFVLNPVTLQGAQFGLARFALYVRPALIGGGNAVLKLRVEQGNPPQPLGGVVTDQNGVQQQVALDGQGETVASAAIPNGANAAIFIAINCTNGG